METEDVIAPVPSEEDKARYIEKLEKHVEKAEEAVKYSVVRFDLLIISLSSAALASTTIVYAKDNVLDASHNVGTLKFSWLMFVTSLVVNLISQVTGYYGNKYDIRVTKNLIRRKRDKSEKGNQDLLLRLCDGFGRATNLLNLLSLISFIIGAVCLIYFFNTNT